MLKKLINECRFALTLESKSPLLIKDGNYKKPEKASKEAKEAVDAVFIKGRTSDKIKDPVQVITDFYIPGTSLRGVIRSHAEKIVRTIVDDDNNPICCDPFDDNESQDSDHISCSKRMDTHPPAVPYSNACVICKLFGCTGTASRINVHDSTIAHRGTTGVRDGIGIDRFTGGVSSGANFKNQVLEGYTFKAEISIRNFELWQLGLLAYVFRDFEEERVTLGFGASKGFGRVKGTIDEIIITYLGAKSNNVLTDIGDDMDSGQGEKYGFVRADTRNTTLLERPESRTDLTYRHEFKVTNNLEFWKTCAKVWNDNLEKFQTIDELKKSLPQDTVDHKSSLPDKVEADNG